MGGSFPSSLHAPAKHGKNSKHMQGSTANTWRNTCSNHALCTEKETQETTVKQNRNTEKRKAQQNGST